MLLVGLIIAVVVLLVMSFMFTKASGGVLGMIRDFFAQFGLSSLSKPEEAILCSLYRCSEGLNGPHTLQYCPTVSPDYNLPTQKGEIGGSQTFANAAGMGQTLQVCDALSDVYAIEVDINKGDTIDKSHLETGGAIGCVCCEPNGQTGDPCAGQGQNVIGTSGLNPPTGYAWFGALGDFSYDTLSPCWSVLKCANTLTSSKDQTLYITTVQNAYWRLVLTNPLLITFTNIVYYARIFDGPPFWADNQDNLGLISPIITFRSSESAPFIPVPSIYDLNPLHKYSKILVEADNAGKRIKALMVEIDVGNGVFVSCDTQEKSVACQAAAAGTKFCNDRYLVKCTDPFGLTFAICDTSLDPNCAGGGGGGGTTTTTPGAVSSSTTTTIIGAASSTTTARSSSSTTARSSTTTTITALPACTGITCIINANYCMCYDVLCPSSCCMNRNPPVCAVNCAAC